MRLRPDVIEMRGTGCYLHFLVEKFRGRVGHKCQCGERFRDAIDEFFGDLHRQVG